MKVVEGHKIPRGARAVAAQWRALAQTPCSGESFHARQVENLPEPARRWLSRAIAADTPLFTSVVLRMRGDIRLGDWRPFTATQVLAPPHGFIWAATARVAGLPVVGFDRYSGGSGQMRWRLGGLIPVMSREGADITRSALGRFASEATALLPTSFPLARWSASPDPDGAVATWRIDGQDSDVHLSVDRQGQLTGVQIQRWGNPAGEPYGSYPFGVSVDTERDFDGVRLLEEFRAGWWRGTDRENEGEFFRATITDAVFR